MLNKVFIKTYPSVPVDKREALRYAGSREEFPLMDECIEEFTSSYRVCFSVLEREKFFLLFGEEGTKPRLTNAEYALVFSATIGIDGDRLISRYTKTQPSKALCFQAIGAEQIESLCDLFCREIACECAKQGYSIGQRFSPGYGEFPLEKQKEIFLLLDCARRIGVSLLDSGLMTPTKSVTAVFGIGKRQENRKEKCEICDKQDCPYKE